MLTDGLQLLGSSTASNFTIASGATLPSTGLTAGELFYQTGVGLNVYTGSGWTAVGSSATSASITAALGYTPAALDGTGVLTSSQVPAIAITDTFVVATQAAMLALTAQTGDVAVRTDSSTSYILKQSPATTLANWQQLLVPNSAVISVNGNVGTVVLSTTDIAEGTRLYYTDARARAAISVSGSGGSYNSTTGVITLTTNTSVSATGNLPTVGSSGVYAGLSTAVSNQPFLEIHNTGNASQYQQNVYMTFSGNNGLELGGFDGTSAYGKYLTVQQVSGSHLPALMTLYGTGLNLSGLAGTGLQLNGSAGTAGQVLTSQGETAAPTWTTVSGGGGSSAASALTGTTMASNVTFSSLTTVGTLSSLAVSGNTVTAKITATVGTGGDAIDASVGTFVDPASGLARAIKASGGIATDFLGATGTVTAALFSGSGASLTALNATNLSTGTVPTARLATGTASTTTFLRGDGTWAAATASSVSSLQGTGTASVSTSTTGTYAGKDGNGLPILAIVNSAAGTNAKYGQWSNSSAGTFALTFLNDANSSSNDVFAVTRSDVNATLMTFKTAGINLSGLASTGLQLNGSAGTAGQILTSGGASATPTWTTPTGPTTLVATAATVPYGVATGAYAGLAFGSSNNYPGFFMNNTSGAANNRVSGWYSEGSTMRFNLQTDAGSNTGGDVFTITRSGQTPTLLTLTGTAINHAGLTSGFQINGSAGTAGQVLTSAGSAAAPTWSSTFTGTVAATGAASSSATTTGVLVGVNGGSPFINLYNSGAATYNQYTRMYSDSSGTFHMDSFNGAAASNDFFSVTRTTGTYQTAQTMTLTAGVSIVLSTPAVTTTTSISSPLLTSTGALAVTAGNGALTLSSSGTSAASLTTPAGAGNQGAIAVTAGASTAGNGGAVTITAGAGTTGAGSITLTAGAITSSGTSIGAITATAGANAGGVGGAVNLTAGQGSTIGGAAKLTAGYGAGGKGGDVTIQSGGSNTGTTPGNIILSAGGAATPPAATSGFVMVQCMAGTPTGTPASVPAGTVAMVLDVTNGKLWAYYSSAWHSLTFNATAGV